jgi:casein kinase 1
MICFLQYTKSVQFEEKPSYQYLKSLLLNLFEKNKLEYDFLYDWYYIDDEKNDDSNERREE